MNTSSFLKRRSSNSIMKIFSRPLFNGTSGQDLDEGEDLATANFMEAILISDMLAF